MSNSLLSSGSTPNGLRLDKATALAIGFGLHNAWVCTAMYSTHEVFGISSFIFPGVRGGSFSFVYLVSILAFALIMFAAAAFDQKLKAISRSRKVMGIAACATCIGTLMAVASPINPTLALILEGCAGVITGFGSAVLILYWGIAFARERTATIAITGSIAVALGFALNTLFLQTIPTPFGGVVAAVIPLVEFLILQKISPRPEAGVELSFNALPTSKPKLGLALVVPIALCGLALGVLKQASVQTTLGGTITPATLVILLLAGSLTISLFTFYSYLHKTTTWDSFFRIVIPSIACASLFVSLLVSEDTAFSDLFLLVAYIFVETLVWVHYAYLSHKFHLSPIFLFGLSRSILTISMLVGAVFVLYTNPWLEQFSLSHEGFVIIPLVLIALGCALMPRESDLVRRIVQCPAVRLVALELQEKLGLLDKLQPSSGDSKRIAPSDAASSEQAFSTQPHSFDATNTGVFANNATSSGAFIGHTTGSGEFFNNAPSALTTDVPTVFPVDAPPVSTVNTPSTFPASEARKAMISQSEPESIVPIGKFSRKVKKVAKTYLLTERETDILFELAKGNSPTYIQEKYYISAGTVKTHIRNVYRKLDVHKRNDLLRMIEEVEDYD